MKRVSQKKSHKNKIIVWSLFFLVLIILAGVIVYQILKDNKLRLKTPSLAESTQNIENKIEKTNIPESKTINRIRVNIDQFLKLPGTCKLTVFSADKIIYTDSVSVISNPSSGSCKGFDIPLTKLSPGEYNIKIEINANQKTGIIEGKVTI